MHHDEFRWTNFSRGTLQELARASGLRVSHAAADLKGRYGEPPAESFVAEVWPTLRDGWIRRTPEAREQLVQMLRKAGLGRTDIKVRSRAGQMDFLRSCRQSDLLRRELLRLFLDAGRRSASTGFGPSDEPAAKSEPNDLIKQFRAACAEVVPAALPMIEFSVAIDIGNVLERVRMPVPLHEREEVAGAIAGAAFFAFYRHQQDVTEWPGAPLPHRSELMAGARRVAISREACFELFIDLIDHVAQALGELADRRDLQLTCTSLFLSRLALGPLNEATEQRQQEFVSSLRWLVRALANADLPTSQREPEQSEPASTDQQQQQEKEFAAFVDQVLRKHWEPIGPHRVREDKIGWVIRHGSSTVAIHAVHYEGASPLLRYRTDLITRVPRSDELLFAINEINRKESYTKLFFEDEVVVMEYDQLALDLSDGQLALSLLQFLHTADALDTLLQNRFGGTTNDVDTKARFHV